MKVATVTGQSDEIRERALKHLWALVRAEEPAAKSKQLAWHTSTRTELVRLFLAEHDDDAAWDVFVGGPVATLLWPRMAAVRGKTHPDDAIALCHRLLPTAAESGTRNARYAEAFEIVRAIRKLRAEKGEQAKFAIELDEIRSSYRAKRNFIKLLDTLP